MMKSYALVGLEQQLKNPKGSHSVTRKLAAVVVQITPLTIQQIAATAALHGEFVPEQLARRDARNKSPNATQTGPKRKKQRKKNRKNRRKRSNVFFRNMDGSGGELSKAEGARGLRRGAFVRRDKRRGAGGAVGHGPTAGNNQILKY